MTYSKGAPYISIQVAASDGVRVRNDTWTYYPETDEIFYTDFDGRRTALNGDVTASVADHVRAMVKVITQNQGD